MLDWVIRAAVALLIGYVVLRIGLASLRPMRGPKEVRYEPVDVIEDGGVPVYACGECGTQLVLLRKGSDKPPRHCGEPMTYAVVTAADPG